MNKKLMYGAIGFLLILGVTGFTYLVAAPWFGGGGMHGKGFFTNNSYVNGLHENVNLIGSSEMFRHIFMMLDDEVTVYPSESYYYFRTTIRGYHFTGAFSLSPDRIDSGYIGFGYAQVHPYRERLTKTQLKPYAREFGDSDGVAIDKIDDFKYAVTFEGKRVVFNLFDGGLEPPKKAKLTKDEVYVGPSFDESGLRFFLIFNKAVQRLYWVLNEDGFVAEHFIPHRIDDIEIGERTEFAFYRDSVNNRKILIGVNVFNVAQNNWCDGPFDQLPDTYVKLGKVELRKYLAAHKKLDPATIDKYGHFGRGQFSRVVIAPYCAYRDLDDLDFVDSLKKLPLPPSEYYAKITEERFISPRADSTFMDREEALSRKAAWDR